MPTLLRHPMGILAFCLVALFAMPASARADSDEVKTINGAVVRIRVIGGKTFIAVRSGTLTLKYANGNTMATIPAGTSLMVGGLSGGPTVEGGTLKLAQLTNINTWGDTNMTVALSKKSPPLTLTGVNSGTFTAQPGKTTTGFTLFSGHTSLGSVFSTDFSTSKTPGADRDLLSETN